MRLLSYNPPQKLRITASSSWSAHK